MCRYRLSPATAIVEEGGEAIGLLRGRRWESEILEAPSRASDGQRFGTKRNDLGDGRVSVENRDRSALPYRLEVFAEAGLEIGDTHSCHDYI